MILLGTHNSLSYLPCQWYLRPFAWVGRCQSLTLEKQYAKGIRWFDIRVKYIGGEALSGHGLLTYNVSIPAVLNYLNRKKDCIVRLYLENSKRNPTKFFKNFAADIANWQRAYSDIRFVEGGCRYAYKRFIEDDVPAEHRYWHKGDTIIPYPKWFAKRNNPVNHLQDNEYKYTVYDFIQY